MSIAQLHPEHLFDALRAGELDAANRLRLEAHCARCTACLFELRWLDALPVSQAPTAEDCAYGEAAFDNVLRTRVAPDARTGWRNASWTLPLSIGGLLLLGSAAGVWLAMRSPMQEPRHVAPITVEYPSARSSSRVRVDVPVSQAVHEQPVTPRPSANQLLAAARRAQSRGQLDHAQILYKQVIDSYAATQAAGTAQVALGRLMFAQHQPSAAETLFGRYLHRRPHGALAEEALYYRALSLEQLGDAQQAAVSFSELIRAYPRSLYAAPAREHLGAESSK